MVRCCAPNDSFAFRVELGSSSNRLTAIRRCLDCREKIIQISAFKRWKLADDLEKTAEQPFPDGEQIDEAISSTDTHDFSDQLPESNEAHDFRESEPDVNYDSDDDYEPLKDYLTELHLTKYFRVLRTHQVRASPDSCSSPPAAEKQVTGTPPAPCAD